jgi:hypothetical protein
MSDSKTVEQQRLRDERARLDGQRVELQADTVRLQISRDIALLRALCDRLASHRAEMAALSAALHDYHAKYGPLSTTESAEQPDFTQTD